MIRRVVVAVDDSAPALAAAAAAIEAARLQPTELTFVAVAVAQGGLDTGPILAHVQKLADRAGVTAAGISCVHGPAFEAILAEAHRMHADMIVIGRSDKQRPGSPHVGSQTGHLIEFTDIPVLVVPTPPPHAATSSTQSTTTAGDTP